MTCSLNGIRIVLTVCSCRKISVMRISSQTNTNEPNRKHPNQHVQRNPPIQAIKIQRRNQMRPILRRPTLWPIHPTSDHRHRKLASQRHPPSPPMEVRNPTPSRNLPMILPEPHLRNQIPRTNHATPPTKPPPPTTTQILSP